MARITGRVEVTVNGILLLNKPGATMMGLGKGDGTIAYNRTAVVGDTGSHGFTEEFVPPRCEVTVTDREDISLGDLYAIEGTGTLVFRAARGGKVYTLNNVTCMEALNVTAGEGETPLVFEAVDGGGWYETTGN